MTVPSLVLASASPARLRLLQGAGFKPIVQSSNFDEDSVQAASPSELVQTLALRKAETVARQFANHATTAYLILGCDSILAIAGEIHGKPANAEEAIARWQKMRGQSGELYTGHAFIDLPVGKVLSKARILVRFQMTRVYFAEVSDRQIAAYVATGEPLFCAGCFALEGKGGLFVEKLEGCHTNVIGLSLPLLRSMIADLGYDVVDFW
ncbi:MAG: nucleoside triphosphate pyrophosphatase [Leptolyngbyaceae bacterium]|nr:nucleoside triphosphate pyrophosphatase [Leptolyngbyaceae bacterium]